jgi:hypothetical protein
MVAQQAGISTRKDSPRNHGKQNYGNQSDHDNQGSLRTSYAGIPHPVAYALRNACRFYVKCLLLFSNLNKIVIYRQNLTKLFSIKFEISGSHGGEYEDD